MQYGIVKSRKVRFIASVICEGEVEVGSGNFRPHDV